MPLNNPITASEIHAILTTEGVLQDPICARGYQQFQVLNLFLDTLVKKDSKKGIVSGIAQSWKISADQRTYTFSLSEQAHFHNAEPIFAQDVAFSLRRHLDENSKSVVASYLRNVLDKILVIDNRTVEFCLKGAYPAFLELLSLPGFGIISHQSTSNYVIGSGPYEFEPSETKTWCLRKSRTYPFPTSNIDRYYFKIERDVDLTVDALNSGRANLAMGSPLEVALARNLKPEYKSHPTFSLVTTHIILNHNNTFLKDFANRKLVADVARFVRDTQNVLTKFDGILDTYLPNGIMPESYYAKSAATTHLPKLQHKQKIKIVFPYGIFLSSAVEKIVKGYEDAGFEVNHINVKGKELSTPMQEGDFDLIFIPYQGVIPDPDGYLDILGSLLAKANLPTFDLLKNLSEVRFTEDKKDRLEKYSTYLQDFEKNLHVIPFSQNSIPIVCKNNIKIPDLEYSYHLNLRDLNMSDEE
ncbi:ABC transporter substrate-binding protein [Bdellovibrio reynosensis]|uniref:ABC transporter substrate-binding protein n=1 Tax=Bdellovibrio reynosensis TaxID=2835041 RepID=A0ABY4CA00_9BACT|nr:ABC transporter substrate-binding protein [Bdellovibrio reynosensis]UOF00506.1 ABC transporter substrate-binding protein [Bdellovibrio reynosensis]